MNEQILPFRNSHQRPQPVDNQREIRPVIPVKMIPHHRQPIEGPQKLLPKLPVKVTLPHRIVQITADFRQNCPSNRVAQHCVINELTNVVQRRLRPQFRPHHSTRRRFGALSLVNSPRCVKGPPRLGRWHDRSWVALRADNFFDRNFSTIPMSQVPVVAHQTQP